MQSQAKDAVISCEDLTLLMRAISTKGEESDINILNLIDASPSETIDQTDGDGRTALMKAAFRGLDAACVALLQKGADPFKIDCLVGDSAFSEAIFRGCDQFLILVAKIYTETLSYNQKTELARYAFRRKLPELGKILSEIS